MTIKQGPWWCKPGVRHRLEPYTGAPMRRELPAGETVRVTYPELQEHAHCEELAAVLCVAGTFTSVEIGWNAFPRSTKLYTRQPQVLGLWPGDDLEFRAVKAAHSRCKTRRPARWEGAIEDPGSGLVMVPMRPVLVARGCAEQLR